MVNYRKRLINVGGDQYFTWVEGIGGFLPIAERVYDDAYFDKYVGYASTDMGKAISAYRVMLVNKYTTGTVVDVGCGCGAFVDLRGSETFGYDIMGKAVAWLKTRDKFVDIQKEHNIESVCFWDSLEHLYRFGWLLDKVNSYVFLTIPLFNNCDDVFSSKHYRPDEHYWYFTEAGMIKVMLVHGFHLVEKSYTEVELGREGVTTFVFKKDK